MSANSSPGISNSVSSGGYHYSTYYSITARGGERLTGGRGGGDKKN